MHWFPRDPLLLSALPSFHSLHPPFTSASHLNCNLCPCDTCNWLHVFVSSNDVDSSTMLALAVSLLLLAVLSKLGLQPSCQTNDTCLCIQFQPWHNRIYSQQFVWLAYCFQSPAYAQIGPHVAVDIYLSLSLSLPACLSGKCVVYLCSLSTVF